MARTAVIAGTATAVSGGVQRRQAERAEQGQQQQWEQQQQWAAQQQAAAPAAAEAPAPAVEESVVDQLTKLGELKAQGILTDEEFEAAKAKVLAG